MRMPKEMITRFYLHNTVSERCIPPMDTNRLVENHNRWLMGNNDISVIGYQGLWMVISYPIKPDPINLNTRVLEKV